MQITESQEIAAEKPVASIALDTSKLLGFRHIEADASEEGFAEDAAATFNKIGEGGEGPITRR